MGTSAVAGRLRLDGGPPGEIAGLALDVSEERERGSAWSRTHAAPDGSFRFEGVPADWSGNVLLPAHYRLARPDEHGRRTRAFPARAWDLALEIDVERVPTLRGRVLGAADRAPVAGLRILLNANWGDSSYVDSTETDGQGRFRHPLRGDKLLELTLSGDNESGTIAHATWDATTLPGPDLRGDVDLGDLILQPARTAVVVVLDPDGRPFAGARVVERGQLLGRAVETGADGRAEVYLSDALESLEVQARGYSIVSLPPPAPGTQVEVRLRPANRLVIEVVDVHGMPWLRGRVRLSAARPPFADGRDTLDDYFVGAHAPLGTIMGRDRQGSFVYFTTDESGRVELQSLEVGQAFELAVEDVLNAVGGRRSCTGLADAEHRVERLALEREGWRVTGRCVDGRRAPLAGARVELRATLESLTLECDTEGSFASPLLLVETLRLRASAAGFADVVLDAVAPPAELELVLEPGRDLRVALHDERGVPVTVGDLNVRSPVTGTGWVARESQPGVFDFAGVPAAPLELEYRWHGLRFTADVDAVQETFDWTLPTLGRLEVHVPRFEGADDESCTLLLEALDGERKVVEQRSVPSEGDSDFEFSPWPGNYRLRRVVHSYVDSGSGFRTPAGKRDLGEPTAVEVQAGAVARVALEGPR